METALLSLFHHCSHAFIVIDTGGGHVCCLPTCLFVCLFQSVNAPTGSKMKVWKCAAIALTLCGAGLALFLTDIMVPTAPSHQPAWAPSSHASSSSSSSSSSPLGASRQRRARSTDGMSSILTERKSTTPLFFLSGYGSIGWSRKPRWDWLPNTSSCQLFSYSHYTV